MIQEMSKDSNRPSEPLRHSTDSDLSTDPGNMFEGDAEQLGERNPLSVMNYRKEAPELQPSDISATQTFYKLPAGTEIQTTPIVDFVPM